MKITYAQLSTIVLSAFVPFLSVNANAAGTFQYCEVSASGTLPSGPTFDGSFTDDGVDFLADWLHNAPGVSIELTSVAMSPPEVGMTTCRTNGVVRALINGYATYNGVDGYVIEIEVVDNRAAPTRVTLDASITRRPTRRSEGTITFGEPTTVIVPSEIEVTAGASGHGWTRLHLDEIITCRYRGNGEAYLFERCTDPLNTGYAPGTSIDVTSARLRVQNADSAFDLTTVTADLGVLIEAPGAADTYQIWIGETRGLVGPPYAYQTFEPVIDGDINITILGPKPPP